MSSDDAIPVSSSVAIPRDELLLRASRSGGPGGQHVNTSSTRIELVWNISVSPSLDETQRHRLLRRLASRLDTEGKLRLVAQDERSQLRNRVAVLERFQEIVSAALIPPRPRKATKPSRAAKRARLDAKRRHSERKRERRRAPED